MWNHAQDNCLLWQMPGLNDAPLSVKGRKQCATHLLGNVVRNNKSEFDSFLQDSRGSGRKNVIYSSPLTRAMETAVIGFQDYMGDAAGAIDELVLLPAAREEKGSAASIDSNGVAVGDEVVKRLKEFVEQNQPTGNRLKMDVSG